jgi:deoxycytidine triphosphate deaminase
MLADKDIKKYIKDKRIKIYPEPNFDKSLGSCSIDLRLGEIAGSHAVMPFMASKIIEAGFIRCFKLLTAGKFILCSRFTSVGRGFL